MVICLNCRLKMKKQSLFTEKNYVIINWLCLKCGRLYQKKRTGKTARYHLDADYRKAKIENAKQSRKDRNEANN
jgi:hypothetical protein